MPLKDILFIIKSRWYDSDVLSEWMLSRFWLPDCVTILFCEDVSGWALGEKFASLNHTCQTINLYSSYDMEKS